MRWTYCLCRAADDLNFTRNGSISFSVASSERASIGHLFQPVMDLFDKLSLGFDGRGGDGSAAPADKSKTSIFRT